jgi:hypothetical protein
LLLELALELSTYVLSIAANVTFNDNRKTENGELTIRGIKRKITMVMFILLNNVTTDAKSVHHFVLSTNGPFV